MHPTSLFSNEVLDKGAPCRVSFSHTDFKGIKVDQKEIKITQYADGTKVLVSGESIRRPLKLLEELRGDSRLEITPENRSHVP